MIEGRAVRQTVLWKEQTSLSHLGEAEGDRQEQAGLHLLNFAVVHFCGIRCHLSFLFPTPVGQISGLYLSLVTTWAWAFLAAAWQLQDRTHGTCWAGLTFLDSDRGFQGTHRLTASLFLPHLLPAPRRGGSFAAAAFCTLCALPTCLPDTCTALSLLSHLLSILPGD